MGRGMKFPFAVVARAMGVDRYVVVCAGRYFASLKQREFTLQSDGERRGLERGTA